MRTKAVSIAPYAHIKTNLPFQMKIRVPREFAVMPRGAVMIEGYRLLALGESPRQTIGYLLPGQGIYDPSGILLKKLEGTEGIDFFSKLPQEIPVKKRGTIAIVDNLRTMRFVVDKETQDIIGILRSTEFRFIPDYGKIDTGK